MIYDRFVTAIVISWQSLAAQTTIDVIRNQPNLVLLKPLHVLNAEQKWFTSISLASLSKRHKLKKNGGKVMFRSFLVKINRWATYCLGFFVINLVEFTWERLSIHRQSDSSSRLFWRPLAIGWTLIQISLLQNVFKNYKSWKKHRVICLASWSATVQVSHIITHEVCVTIERKEWGRSQLESKSPLAREEQKRRALHLAASRSTPSRFFMPHTNVLPHQHWCF